MPTTGNRVPSTFTVTVNGAQLELPARHARVSVISTSEEEFSTILRGLLATPGATAPTTANGTAAVVAFEWFEVLVLAPVTIREQRTEVFSPALDAAIADAVNVTGAAA